MYFIVMGGEIIGTYETIEQAKKHRPKVVKARNEWQQCPYCGEWFFAPKRKFCSDKCRIKFWNVIGNDTVKSAIPYFNNAEIVNGRLKERA